MRARAAHFYPYSTPPYTPVAFIYHNGGGPSEVCLSIVHFGSWCIRQVSCYTLLGRFLSGSKEPKRLLRQTPLKDVGV